MFAAHAHTTTVADPIVWIPISEIRDIIANIHMLESTIATAMSICKLRSSTCHSLRTNFDANSENGMRLTGVKHFRNSLPA